MAESEENHDDIDYQMNQLKCYGFLRDFLNDQINYNAIISIVIEYLQQVYAIYFDESIDKDYKQRMKSGDIVRTGEHEYKCMSFTISMIDVGDCETEFNPDECEDTLYVEIQIPWTVCKHLENAHLFYSKIFPQIKASADSILWEYQMTLHVKHNDAHVVQLFGGALRAEIAEINFHYAFGEEQYQHHLNHVYLNYDGQKHPKWLNSEDIKKINDKDINKYYEIRLTKDDLVKLKVALVVDYYVDLCDSLPFHWAAKSLDDDANLVHFYVGLFEEKNAIISRLKEFYANEAAKTDISTVELEDSDILQASRK